MPAHPVQRIHPLTPSNPFGAAPPGKSTSIPTRPKTPTLTSPGDAIFIPRPKSSGGGGRPYPYIHTAATGSGSASAGPSSPIGAGAGAGPIMVALSGWPEPVYVAESRDFERRRSRPGTPVLSSSLPPLSGEIREGINLGSYSYSSNLATGSAGTSPGPAGSGGGAGIFTASCPYTLDTSLGACPIPGHPNHYGYELPIIPPRVKGTFSGSGESPGRYSPSAIAFASGQGKNQNIKGKRESPFPTSSARSTNNSPTSSPPLSPTKLPYPHPPQLDEPQLRAPGPGPGSSELHLQHLRAQLRPNLPKGYPDPRYYAVPIRTRPISVVPSWSSSSSSSQARVDLSPTSSATPGTGTGAGVGVKVEAGQRGEAVWVLRSVPDVYPPPPRDAMGIMAGLPGMGMSMGSGVAREVYPRDPNNAFLWSGASPARTDGVGTSSIKRERRGSDESMDMS